MEPVGNLANVEELDLKPEQPTGKTGVMMFILQYKSSHWGTHREAMSFMLKSGDVSRGVTSTLDDLQIYRRCTWVIYLMH